MTNEIVGPFKNGGIGTAMTGLTETLACAGFEVTVLYTGALWTLFDDTDLWIKKYRAIGVDFRVLDQTDLRSLSGPLKYLGFPAPYLIYMFLCQHEFDVVHFTDTLGEGFYCLVAKRMGTRFKNTLFVVGLHSPSQWVLESNAQIPNNILYAAYNYAERLSVQCADILWSPSTYMINWIIGQDFVLPRATIYQQYIMPTNRLFDSDPTKISESDEYARASGVRRRPTELVFFGRLEERKGIRLFCAALDVLGDFLATNGVSVTFLGKSMTENGVTSVDYLATRASKWKFVWTKILDYGQQEAVKYLTTTNSLAVIPSPSDNSPCTVYEALNSRIPFVAARTGGIPELIATDDHGRVLFDYSVASLVGLLRRGIEQGIDCARPAVAQSINRQHWIDAHLNWKQWLERAREEPGPKGLVNCESVLVVVEDLASPEALNRTISSVCTASQDGCAAEILVIRRNTPAIEIESRKGTLVIVTDVQVHEAGPVVLESLEAGRSGLVIFLYAGVTLVEDSINTLSVIFNHAEVDGVVPAAMAVKGGRQVIIPSLGGSAAFGFFEGLSFTGGAAVKRERLSLITRRFPLVADKEFLGLLDLAISAGLVLWPLPEPVLNIGEPHLDTGLISSEPRRIRPFTSVDPNEMYYIAALGYHAYTDHKMLHWERRLWMQLSETRLYRVAHSTWCLGRRLRTYFGYGRDSSLGRRVSRVSRLAEHRIRLYARKFRATKILLRRVVQALRRP